MLTLQDCLDFCDMSEDIIEAIAEHDHLPPILAAQLAECLSCAPGGMHVIHQYLCDNASRCCNAQRRSRITASLESFVRAHPEVRA